MTGVIAQQDNIRPAVIRILFLSAAAVLFLVWILYFRASAEPNPDALSFLPAVNATLNGLAAACIIAGFFAIRRGARRLHMTFMIAAVCLSALFLVSYITYHTIHGDTVFTGEGFIRYVYFFTLISHMSCTLFALPLIMSAIFFAATKRFKQHRKVVRYTVPLWLYVSLTGVAIFVLLNANS